MHYTPDLAVVTEHWQVMLLGLRMTLYLAVTSMACALVMGLLLAIIRVSRIMPLVWLTDAYIQFFRGIPQFVFLLWLYYGVSLLIGINFQPITAGVIALSVQYGAYL